MRESGRIEAFRSPALVAFRAGDHRCAVSAGVVTEVCPVVAITPIPDPPAGIEGLVDAHGALVGVVNLSACLEGSARPLTVDDQLVFVETPRRTLALHVDPEVELIDADPVVLDVALRDEQGRVRGAVRLDGELLLLLDLDRFLSSVAAEALDAAIERQSRVEAR